jgi:galactosyl transferase GMA12/MNN10 family
MDSHAADKSPASEHGFQRTSICMISGCTKKRLFSEINHAYYAANHSYDYNFDVGPYAELQNAYFLKLLAVERVIANYDWVFWLDDDAFITDFSIRLEHFLHNVEPSVFMVACKSPVNSRGGWTFLSSGAFLLRRCAESSTFIANVKAVQLSDVKAWWNRSKYGMFTNGDQDAMTYLLHQRGLLPLVKLLPYEAFNTRTYHFTDSPREHFIVHFPGSGKAEAVRAFAKKFRLDEMTLIPL